MMAWWRKLDDDNKVVLPYVGGIAIVAIIVIAVGPSNPSSSGVLSSLSSFSVSSSGGGSSFSNSSSSISPWAGARNFPKKAPIPKGVAAFSQFYVTDKGDAAIKACGFTDTEDQRRQLLDSPPLSDGRIIVKKYDANGTLQGRLEMRQARPTPGIYLVTCTK